MQQRTKNGFTLIELLVVIAIIAILAAILFPVFAQARAKARQTACMSNMKQIGTATLMYAQDYDETVGRKWWEFHVDLEPYVKNISIFTCPGSAAPKPEKRFYPAVRWSAGGGASGEFWTNTPANPTAGNGPTNRECKEGPCLFGHYTRNDEILHNYGWSGQISRDLDNPNMRMASWERPADVVFYGEARSGAEDNDNNDFDADNAAYIEPGGTAWTEVYQQLSARHNEGLNITFLDGHAAWRNFKWFRTPEGKYAVNPSRKDYTDTRRW